MKKTNAEVSIDQMARLARQAGAYTHQHTAEVDRAALNLQRNARRKPAGGLMAQRVARAVGKFLRR